MRHSDATTAQSPQASWRPQRYADGKPRPLLRGVLHGALSVSLAAGVSTAVALGCPELAFGLGGKLVTCTASAFFHLYPFKSIRGVTRAFVLDIACVPAALAGTAFAFTTSASSVREASLAAAVAALNGGAVAWQCRGQLGLKTRIDRTDAPRSVIVTLYGTWAVAFVGLSAGFGGAWLAMVALVLLAGAFSGPVTGHVENMPSWPADPPPG